MQKRFADLTNKGKLSDMSIASRFGYPSIGPKHGILALFLITLLAFFASLICE